MRQDFHPGLIFALFALFVFSTHQHAIGQTDSLRNNIPETAHVQITAQAAEKQSSPPNILLILADDLGYSDLGCYGSEIETPNLDRMAVNGIRCSQFYNTGRCWPTRASLLTGYYAQAVRRDQVPGVVSGGQGERPTWAPLLPSLLNQAGYRCYHSGKWHLDGLPLETGFLSSYLLKDQGRFFHPKVHFLNDSRLSPIPEGTDFYATTTIAATAIDQLQTHSRNHPDSPFFLYLAFTAPHFPLQAPQALIDKYRPRYQVGWDQIREQRWNRLKQLGFIHGTLSDVQPNVGPPYQFPKAIEQLGAGEIDRPLPWKQLSEEQQAFQAEKMAIHAAMIDAMDSEIGNVLAQLEAMKATENTLILFLSDNGASAEIMVRDDGHDPQAPMGSADSYLCLGPGWSTSCNTPFRYHKTWVHEGGIATPAIVHWPAGLKNSGTVCQQPFHVIDLFPTAIELANLTTLSQKNPSSESDDILTPTRPGRSILSMLQATSKTNSKFETAPNVAPLSGDDLDAAAERALYWSHEGNRAIRLGDWKLVAVKDGPWELFNLRTDRAETNNLAAANPDRVQQLANLWNQLNLQQAELAK